MLACGLASKPCSEVTNMAYLSFWELTVAGLGELKQWVGGFGGEDGSLLLFF